MVENRKEYMAEKLIDMVRTVTGAKNTDQEIVDNTIQRIVNDIMRNYKGRTEYTYTVNDNDANVQILLAKTLQAEGFKLKDFQRTIYRGSEIIEYGKFTILW